MNVLPEVRGRVTAALRDPDVNVRQAAQVMATPEAWRIVTQGNTIERLHSEVDDVRWAAAAALVAEGKVAGGVADEKVLAIVRETARGTDGLVRGPLVAAVYRGWRERRDPVELLTAWAADAKADEVARVGARAALKAIEAGSAAGPAVRAELEALGIALVERAGRVRTAAAVQRVGEVVNEQAPAELRARAAVALAAVIAGGSRDARYEATLVLARLGEPGVRAIAGLLKDEDPAVRGMGAARLGQIGAGAMSVAGELAAVAKGDADDGVRALAAEAEVSVRVESELAAGDARRLVAYLWDERNPIRHRVAEALRKVAARGDLRVALAMEMYDREQVPARIRWQALSRFARGPDSPTRERAERLGLALHGLGAASLIERQEAAARIRADGVLGEKAGAALERAVRGGDLVVREGLVLGLGRAWRRGETLDEALAGLEGELDGVQKAYVRGAARAIK
ncbi:MAG TPA: HEAT repeat domain-containing protein [Tepidisphaeraceae bacterium]|nr:HEAT repeat domain-containing protein [Tepidisphaeraceae bacterium]